MLEVPGGHPSLAEAPGSGLLVVPSARDLEPSSQPDAGPMEMGSMGMGPTDPGQMDTGSEKEGAPMEGMQMHGGNGGAPLSTGDTEDQDQVEVPR